MLEPRKLQRVAVIGASPNRERYSNKAVRRLVEAGHQVIPVNPGHKEIEGLTTVRSLEEVPPGSVDTITMYVGKERSSAMGQTIASIKPERIIFNPGAENEFLAAELKTSGIEVVEGCTLVMLSLGEF